MHSSISISNQQQMQLPNLLSRVFLFAGLIAYTLFFGEVFIRIAAPQVLFPRYITGTPWGVRGNIPNARYRHQSPEVDVQFAINSQGMRADHDYMLAKPAGVCRVALFGDSYFMGYELNLKDTFASRIEEKLRKDGYNVEVLNFAVSGFGTEEMLRTYENYGRRFSPDIVIFQWHGTDFDDNVRSNLYRIKEGKLESTGQNYLPGVKVQDFLMRSAIYRLVADNSHLYSFVRERVAKFVKLRLVESAKASQQASETPAENRGSSTVVAQDSNAVALSVALLLEAKQVINGEGRDFFIVDIPVQMDRMSFDSSLGAIPELAPGLNIVSPVAAFKELAAPDIKLYYERGHRHLTPLGVEGLLGVAIPALEGSAKLKDCVRNK